MNRAGDDSQPRPKSALLVHEKTYAKSYVAGFVHRARLKAILNSLQRHVPPATKSWADFGCSNGFVIENGLKELNFGFDRITGFDQTAELLELARAKQIRNATFAQADMTQAFNGERSELVTCFETLEHVSDFRPAFEHLHQATAPGGLIVVSVPNETGLPGLTKLWARRLVRRNPYGDFFADSSLTDYTKRLVTGGYIDGFRKPKPTGYGPHLGFDYRRLLEHIDREYIKTERVSLIELRKTTLRMNVIAVYRRSVQGEK